MSIDTNGLIEWIPLNGVESSGTVTVEVVDGGEDDVIATEQQFVVVVIPVNDPPTIISIPEILEIMVYDTFYYQIEVEDIDDDQFSYVLLDAPDGMSVNQLGFVSWVPQFPGNYGPITILVSDGGEDEVEPDQQEFLILVNAYTDKINYCLNLHSGANLKSFYALPEDASIEHIMSSLGTSVEGIITEGGASSQIEPGVWVGSIDSVKPE